MSRKPIVEGYVAAFNRGDLDGVCRHFSADAEIWGVLGWGGLDAVRPIWRSLIDALQMQLEITSLIEEGPIVAARYVERGQSVAPFQGFAPTGRRYEVIAMEWFETRDGLIRRRWGARDSASMYRQLGFDTTGAAPAGGHRTGASAIGTAPDRRSPGRGGGLEQHRRPRPESSAKA